MQIIRSLLLPLAFLATVSFLNAAGTAEDEATHDDEILNAVVYEEKISVPLIAGIDPLEYKSVKLLIFSPIPDNQDPPLFEAAAGVGSANVRGQYFAKDDGKVVRYNKKFCFLVSIHSDSDYWEGSVRYDHKGSRKRHHFIVKPLP